MSSEDETSCRVERRMVTQGMQTWSNPFHRLAFSVEVHRHHVCTLATPVARIGDFNRFLSTACATDRGCMPSCCTESFQQPGGTSSVKFVATWQLSKLLSRPCLSSPGCHRLWGLASIPRHSNVSRSKKRHADSGVLFPMSRELYAESGFHTKISLTAGHSSLPNLLHQLGTAGREQGRRQKR